MDKRTILFALAVFATLFLVNLYFDSQHEENLRKWNEQQSGKRTQKLQELEATYSSKIAKPDDLPLASAYADAQGNSFLTSGVLVDKTFFTLAWDSTPPPKEIFVRKQKSSETPSKLNLLYSHPAPGSVLLYQEGDKSTVTIGNLPDVGSYDLQLIALHDSNEQKPFEIILGEYTDGVTSVVKEQIETLKKLLDQKYKPIEAIATNALVLRKENGNFLPVGLYQKTEKNLVLFEDIPGLDTIVKTPQEKGLPKAVKQTQQYYVLENEFQQLVFTNIGGSLVEINLPFESGTDKESVVKEIEIDRDMIEKHPYNARFPSHSYFTPGKNPRGPFTDNSEGKLGGYYPLIRRDLIEKTAERSVRINPRYYSLNILSEYPEISELIYEVKHFDKNTIVFEAQQQHRKITKTYSLPKDKSAPYIFDLSMKIDGDARGLWISSGVPEVEMISGSPAPALKYRITRNQKADVESVNLPTESTTNASLNPDWIANSNGFFGIIIDPLTEIGAGFKAQYVPGQTVPSRFVEIDQEYEKYTAQSLPGYLLMMPLKNSTAAVNFRIFAGPFSDDILKEVDAIYSDTATGYNPDYVSCQTYHGWFTFISQPFAKFLFILMKFFYSLTGSWAFSIILLTVALRIMMYPLNAWSTKSMVRMQQITPEVTAIQEKYKKDPKKAQLEIMNLYRERGVNPVSGCFPLLIQMPFLIGMFDLLKSTFELRGASFIPGWIDNLTAPDVLFSWDTPIPFFGNSFHLLPVLLGLVMFAQQKMFSNLPTDPALMTDQQKQQKAMGSIMAVVFTVMFYHFPSGLNIYWLSSMLLGVAQQWWTQKQMAKAAAIQAKPKA